MSGVAILLWIANVAFETAGHLTLKAAARLEANGLSARWRRMLTSPLLWVGVAFFVAEFIGWFALLSLIPLSLAMLINCVNIVSVILAGRLFFGERLDFYRVAGALLVSFGVALAGVGA